MFEFSGAARLADLQGADTSERVFLGFASPPEANAFTHKFQGSAFGSTTAAVIGQRDRLRGRDPDATTFVLHTVQGGVTLDVAVAALAVKQAIELGPAALDSPAWALLQDYIDFVERGGTLASFEGSLYAWFYGLSAIMRGGKSEVTEDQAVNERLVEAFWADLDAVLSSGGLTGPDDLHRFVDQVPSAHLRPVREVIEKDRDRYIQDHARAEVLELELPLKQPRDAQRFARVRLLATELPRSRFLKFFSRAGFSFPDGQQRRFPLMYVHNPHRQEQSSRHVISVPNDADYNLAGLHALLEEIEDRAGERDGLPPRSRESPRQGFDYADPWYEDRFQTCPTTGVPLCSILDNPRSGSSVSRRDVLEAMWFTWNPLAKILVRRFDTSFFIPVWLGEGFLPDGKTWQKRPTVPTLGDAFLPHTDTLIDVDSKELATWRYEGEQLRLALAPQRPEAESVAVDLIRERTLARSKALLEAADKALVLHVYDLGLCLLEVRISLGPAAPPAEPVSFIDTQWLEDCVSRTPAAQLFGDVAGIDASIVGDDRLLYPRRHFSCSTADEMEFQGGGLSDGRSTAGALRMVSTDAEPLYFNLPVETELTGDQVVRDVITKRTWCCSSSSLLSFDEATTAAEHAHSHAVARLLMNMVLTQRFVLEKSRTEIVQAERQNVEARSLSFLGWLKRKARGQASDHVDIGDLRDRILHLVTSSWFEVISNDVATQTVFERLKAAMYVDRGYHEVKDRTADLDEFLSKREAEIQSRIFGIFTFVLGPLNFALGFIGGRHFDTVSNPFPGVEGTYDGWAVLGVYVVLAAALIVPIYLYTLWRSARGD